MKPLVSLEGTITPGGTTVFTVPSGKLYQILSLRFNNPAAYTLTISKYNAANAATLDVYTLSLSAGDTVTDNMLYIFDPGDQLILDSSVAGTVYFINTNIGL